MVGASCNQDAPLRLEFSLALHTVLYCLPAVRIERFAIFRHIGCCPDIHQLIFRVVDDMPYQI